MPEASVAAVGPPRGGLGWPDEAASAGRVATPRVPLPLERLVQAWSELLGEGRRDLFDVVESSLIHEAYRLCGHNQVRTARALGITRNMLRTQLKRHGLLKGGVEEGEGDGSQALSAPWG